jgi:hypothetical protein
MAKTTLELVQGKGKAAAPTIKGLNFQQDEIDRICGGVSSVLRENGVDLDVVHAVEDILLGQRTGQARRLQLLTRP